MLYCVEDYSQRVYQEFTTYRQAEIYCGENNISCENIYEIGEGF